MPERFVKNVYADYDAGKSSNYVDYETAKFSPQFLTQLQSTLDWLIVQLDGHRPRAKDDPSVYTGVAGIALVNMHLAKTNPKKYSKRATLAADQLDDCINHASNKREITFLCGSVGALALRCSLVDGERGNALIGQICAMKEKTGGCPSELLYGSAGYLYALLYVKRAMLDKKEVPPTEIDEICQLMFEHLVDTGVRTSLSHHLTEQCPLLYEWHNTLYLGAAHGLAGILYVMMEGMEPAQFTAHATTIRRTLDYCLAHFVFPSGNVRSSAESTADKLVHWCHGAPGWMYTVLKAYEVFAEERYAKVAEQFGEVIWTRGILRPPKGNGLCHGVAGNALALIRLWQTTKQTKHLHRAVMFVSHLGDQATYADWSADRPFSLMEGIAGPIHVLSSVIRDMKSTKFPAYQL